MESAAICQTCVAYRALYGTIKYNKPIVHNTATIKCKLEGVQMLMGDVATGTDWN